MKWIWFVLLLSLAPGCASHPPPDTSGLSPQGRRDFNSLQVVRVVNDVTTGAVTANRTGQLSDAATDGILTVNYQVLDFIEANPQGTRAQLVAAIRNTRDALPATINALIDNYVARVLAAINEVQP